MTTKVKYETQCETGCELCDPWLADEDEARRQARVVEAWLRPVNTQCPACRGTGGSEWNDCGYCDGNGVV